MLKTNKSIVQLANLSHGLYLANLIILPGVGLLLLLVFFFKYRNYNRWLNIHLFRSVQLSILATVILLVPLLYILFSQQIQYYFAIMLLYFIIVHSGLILIGVINLALSMVNRLPIVVI